MNYKKFLFFLILILFCLSVNAVCANEVNNTNDDFVMLDEDIQHTVLQQTIKPSGNEFSDIENVIQQAEDGDIIELSGEYYPENYGWISVDSKVTIQGSTRGATINGDANDIFYVNSPVTFKNLKFINFSSAINAEAKVTIINCTFDAMGVEDSSAIQSYTDLTVRNSKFFNGNNKKFYGGAISSEGGNVLIENCLFDNNIAQMGSSIYGYGGKLDIINSIFTNNYAVENSGIFADEKITTIKNSTFKNNRAGKDAAVIGTESNLKIYVCLFDNNSASDYGSVMSVAEATIFNSNFTNNHGSYMGAVYGGGCKCNKF